MNYEYSCGAVVFTRIGGVPHYLMVHEKTGHWGCPKGHMESGETERETALREIFEETGVRVTLLEGFRAVTEYDLRDRIDTRKRVVFFLAEFQQQELQVQQTEVADFAMVPYEKAMALLIHEDAKRILTRADNHLTGRHKVLPGLTEVVELLEPRPELYIGSRDIRDLFHFLNGFYFAAVQEDPDFDNWLQGDFQDYLEQKYGDNRTINWCHLIRDHEPDGDSTDAFFRLVHEFLGR